jgi:hypothetical protein
MLSVYVVFHDALHPRYYQELDSDEFERITFVAVNEEIPKVYDEDVFKNVIREWELPIYNPNYQKRSVTDSTLVPGANVQEVGVYWHIAQNKVCTSEYIYLCHNDMFFTKGSINNIISKLAPTRGLTIRAMSYGSVVRSSTFGYAEEAFYEGAVHEFKIKNYNTRLYPLFTNCAMSTELFYKIQPTIFAFVAQVYHTPLRAQGTEPASPSSAYGP